VQLGLARAYTRKGMLRDAEKEYQKAFKVNGGNGMSDITLARYALLELRLGKREEAFRAYQVARQDMGERSSRYPFFDSLLPVKELEAVLRMILLNENVPFSESDPNIAERIAEVERILVLSPKLALAHYELAGTLLLGKYENDRAAYRKAAKPHYEAAIKYGTGDLREWAKRGLQQLQNEEHTSKR
jgi:tetratricopeptide (TPR) repeat protein